MLQHFLAEQMYSNILISHIHTILEWDRLNMQIRRSESFLSYKNSLLKIGRPTFKPTYNIHYPTGLKFLNRLRLGLSHLNKHKFKHNFQDCVNPLCSCSLEICTVIKRMCNPLRQFAVS